MMSRSPVGTDYVQNCHSALQSLSFSRFSKAQNAPSPGASAHQTSEPLFCSFIWVPFAAHTHSFIQSEHSKAKQRHLFIYLFFFFLFVCFQWVSLNLTGSKGKVIVLWRSLGVRRAPAKLIVSPWCPRVGISSFTTMYMDTLRNVFFSPSRFSS